MSIKIEREALLTLDAQDVCDILTDSLCSYNAFAGMEVASVSENGDGNFEIQMLPKSAPTAEPKS